MGHFLIYGANGYTGELIARQAVAGRLDPILAGRNRAAVAQLAISLGAEHRIFTVDDAAALEAALGDVPLVLNCAGPFIHTFRPLAEACLATGANYLDITGEISVFESLARLGERAKAANVMLLPGMGFDVVPTDCLAAHLKAKLPQATRMALGFQSLTHVSRGTATTIVENLAEGGVVRAEGVLKRVPAAWKTRVIDFGAGPKTAITIPWGDVSTAYYSTGIGNIEVYTAAGRAVRMAARISRVLRPALGRAPVQSLLKRWVRSRPPGPTAEQRARGVSYIWGEARDAEGRRVVSRIRGPDGYTLTVQAALAGVRRILAGRSASGFQTPSLLFGPEFVRELPGVILADEPQISPGAEMPANRRVHALDASAGANRAAGRQL